MLSLDEMAAKGQAKLRAKAENMAANWKAAKADMKTGYDATPFRQSRKDAYKAGIDAATYHAPDPEKWGRSFKRKMGPE